MLVPILLFTVGLVCLIKGGDWFVDGATGIAKRFHVPDLLIGATVVSIGTTLPEVMVSSTSAVQGISSIAYGNAIGSIICNTSLILALTVAIAPAAVDRQSLILPVIFFFTSAVFYAGIAYFTGNFTRVTGILLLLIFVIYMYVLIKKAIKDSTQTVTDAAASDEQPEDGKKERNLSVEIILLIVGAVLIAVGAKLLVDNGTLIAREMGVPETVIALTFVALGTSLPELVTAIASLAKGHGALSLGNIIGANIFNLVLVSGTAITLRPFTIPSEKKIAGMNASLVIDVPMMFLVMFLATIPTLHSGKLKRYQGIVLLALYTGFCAFQFIN